MIDKGATDIIVVGGDGTLHEVINGFKNFGMSFDEGVTGFGTESGEYGPYTQSQRVEVYHAVAKRLVEEYLVRIESGSTFSGTAEEN